MATWLNEARGKWMYGFQRGGKRYSGYCVDEAGKDVAGKRAADACERRIIAQVEGALKSAPKSAAVAVPGAYTVGQMFWDYAEQHASARRSWSTNMRKHVAELIAFFGPETPAAAITLSRVEDFIVHSRAKLKMVNMGGPAKHTEPKLIESPKGHRRSDATTNRYLTTLRAALNWANRQGKMPPVRVRRLEEADHNPNPVSQDDVRKIMAVAPRHLQVAVYLAASTGLRLDEALGVTVDMVDLERRVIQLGADMTKAGRAQIVMVNDPLADLLERVIAEMPKGCRHLVNWGGRSVTTVRRAWLRALKDAGVASHRFHDLRATFCTTLAMANVPAQVIKEAARHGSYTTTQRYLKVHDDSLKAAYGAAGSLGAATLSAAARPVRKAKPARRGRK